MTQRRHHYEAAFEDFLRSARIPYVAVDEAKKALLPETASPRLEYSRAGDERPTSVKSFDFVIYGESQNLLLEVKGRRISPRTLAAARTSNRGGSTRSRLESWVTQDDVDSLATWGSLFGSGFEPAFVFVYWCDEQPPDALFQEIFESRGRWYALRCVLLSDYRANMKVRSPRWRTVHVSSSRFEQISQPFTAGRTLRSHSARDLPLLEPIGS
ncbi:MAG: HYExAFE family protein [Phycisphaerales bacterium]|nr:HYExAFE family protein [Phycisphaerales bacterium]